LVRNSTKTTKEKRDEEGKRKEENWVTIRKGKDG
jgi:hypothetical protein